MKKVNDILALTGNIIGATVYANVQYGRIAYTLEDSEDVILLLSSDDPDIVITAITAFCIEQGMWNDDPVKATTPRDLDQLSLLIREAPDLEPFSFSGRGEIYLTASKMFSGHTFQAIREEYANHYISHIVSLLSRYKQYSLRIYRRSIEECTVMLHKDEVPVFIMADTHPYEIANILESGFLAHLKREPGYRKDEGHWVIGVSYDL